MLVNHKTEMRLGLLHLPQYVFEPRGIDHIHWRLQDFFQAKLFRAQKVRRQILAVDETFDVVERVAIYRQARVAILLKGARDFFEGAFRPDRGDGRARHHRLAHHRVREFKNPVDQSPLFGPQVTALPRNVNQLPQFGLTKNSRVLQR